MSSTNTPKLGLFKATPGTGERFRTADINANMDKIDAAAAINVKAYGAVGDGVADDSPAINAAVAAAQLAKGTVYFPAGTYRITQTITIYSNVDYVGSGVGATTIKLANGANIDLMVTDQYATLVGGSTQAGPTRWSIRHMTLDGNAANQTSGYVMSVYGSNYIVDSTDFTNGKSGGVRSKWGTNGTNMEARFRCVKIYNNSGIQLDWQGPHDSMFSDLIVFTDFSFHGGTLVAGSKGIVTSGNAASEQFTNVHVWGFHVEAMHFLQPAQVFNGQAEGAQINVWFDNNRSQYHGAIFGSTGTGPATGTEVGLRIGAPASFRGEYSFSGVIWGWASGDKPIEFAADSGGIIHANVRGGTATAAWFGSKSPRTHLHIMSNDRPELSEAPVFYGAGVPTAGLGVVGSFYHRSDGVAGSRIYHKTAVSTWTALTAANL